MKKMSLKSRIMLYFVIIPLGAFITAGCIIILDMFELRKFAAQTGNDIANEAAQESIYALQKEVRAELKMLAEVQAAICQLQMRRALSGMNDLAALYKDIHSGVYRPGDRGFIAGSRPDSGSMGNLTYINYPETLSRKEVEEGLKKLTMMCNAFKFSCAYNDYYSGIGIALPNGLFFKYDWFPVPLDYDVRETRWFKTAVAGKGEFTGFDPARSQSSNKLLLTISKAVVVDGRVEAVLVLDILPQSVSNDFIVTRGTGCFAFIAASSGNIVAKEDLAGKKLLWNISPHEKTELDNITKRIIPGRKMSFATTCSGERLDVAFVPMTPGAWGIGVATPIRNIRTVAGKAVGEIREKKDAYILSTRKYIEARALTYLGIGFIASVIMLSLAVGLALHIGKPVAQLEAGVEQLGKRKLDRKIELNSYDEFQELGDTFNAMALELNCQIESLKENITHQERVRQELLVAAEIQRSMLPDTSAVSAAHDEFDIYAEMHPVKEVGGDFYDFFFVDEKRLFFTIGEISGKGLSAALFMMRSRTLLRHGAEDNVPPDEIFVNVGNELEKNNDSCMFLTGVCGLLDIDSGEVVLSNAGHPPPCLRHSGEFEALQTDKGVVVGALPVNGDQFAVTRLQLKKGDTLFFYTDGVTEAFNARGEEYQFERLYAALRKLSGASPREILDGISDSIADFAEGASQSDDITML
ncbi:MAG: SpoIIE family protein phosphatase, partial [Victivallaceae bacterium]|nr:SpoIIE family protein phosphatase [Victivallaceae bacterium]